ncbi:SLAP domain-containing protein [Lactobacillus crispatus]
MKHNSFVYNKHGKAIKINGKKFYTLKSGELIKARNVKNIVAK